MFNAKVREMTNLDLSQNDLEAIRVSIRQNLLTFLIVLHEDAD